MERPTTRLSSRWWRPRRQERAAASPGELPPGGTDPRTGAARSDDPERPTATSGLAPSRLDVAPNDPLLAYVTSAHGTIDVDVLELDSPALAALRAEGTRLVVPLVSHGELVGMLRLGPRRSEQGYSHDDRKLLEDLAAHAAPAVRVAQLVRQQQAELAQRERIEQELAVAQLIQQQFLPRELPELPGWQVAAYYQPARAVGGDFYDFIPLPEGQVGIVVGDVTDKGVPAALVMATTHSILRAEAPRLVEPAEVLARANEVLVGEMPPHMFVTCLYAVLDPDTGRLRFANAGHNLPNLRHGQGGVTELRATGMPLGLLPGMGYEEAEATLGPGDRLLLHSDGLAEAHSPAGEMFGFPRLAACCEAETGSGQGLIDRLLTELHGFTGAGWEQEDDITLVTLERSAGGERTVVLDEFTVRSVAGAERGAVDRVAKAVDPLGLGAARVERLRTAVAEAVMNAAEHGNRNQADLPVEVRVTTRASAIEVTVTDQGGSQPIPQAPVPDLDAKLAGEQGPRGWGMFLIRNMVDELRTSSDGRRHTIHLVMRLGGAARKEAADGSR